MKIKCWGNIRCGFSSPWSSEKDAMKRHLVSFAVGICLVHHLVEVGNRPQDVDLNAEVVFVVIAYY